MTLKCQAPQSSCGTPSGWRAGGRCVHCRLAHNNDTNSRRGLTSQERYTFLTMHRSGRTIEEAAGDAGVTMNTLVQAARRDGELRAALDGMPIEVQIAARRAELLAALVRCGGNQRLAEIQAGLPLGTANNWRQTDGKFDAAVAAILGWLDSSVGSPPKKPRAYRWQKGRMGDRFRELWMSGATYVEIRAELGISDPTIARWRKQMGLPGRTAPVRSS